MPHQSPLESWQYRCRAAPPPGISCTGSRLLGRTKTATEREEEKWTKQKDQTGIFVKYHHDFKYCRNSKQKRVNSTIHSLLMGKQKKLHRPWTTLYTLSLMYPFTSCAHWFICLFTIWWGLWSGWCGWVAAPRCSLRLWDKKHWLTFRNKMFILVTQSTLIILPNALFIYLFYLWGDCTNMSELNFTPVCISSSLWLLRTLHHFWYLNGSVPIRIFDAKVDLAGYRQADE